MTEPPLAWGIPADTPPPTHYVPGVWQLVFLKGGNSPETQLDPLVRALTPSNFVRPCMGLPNRSNTSTEPAIENHSRGLETTGAPGPQTPLPHHPSSTLSVNGTPGTPGHTSWAHTQRARVRSFWAQRDEEAEVHKDLLASCNTNWDEVAASVAGSNNLIPRCPDC